MRYTQQDAERIQDKLGAAKLALDGYHGDITILPGNVEIIGDEIHGLELDISLLASNTTKPLTEFAQMLEYVARKFREFEMPKEKETVEQVTFGPGQPVANLRMTSSPTT